MIAPNAPAGLANAAAISAGYTHGCALLADSRARCWGNNFYGQLGDSTTTNRASPVLVSWDFAP